MTDVSKQEQIAEARKVADGIRQLWPAKAEEIDGLIAALEVGKTDSISVTANLRFKLEKFHGDIEPGKQPYETIEGQG